MSGHESLIAEQVAVHLRAGTVLDLLPDVPIGGVTEGDMLGWSPRHDVDASFLRELLRLGDGDADPRGLRLRGVRVRGRIDLDYLKARFPFRLQDCLIPDGLSADTAELPALVLDNCHLGNADLPEPALNGARLRVTGTISLYRSTIRSASANGTVRLGCARMGDLRCRSAVLLGSAGPAFRGNGLVVTGNAGFDGVTAEGRALPGSVGGAVQLGDATIGGQLNFRGANLRCWRGSALVTDGAQIGGRMFLDHGFTAAGEGKFGAVRLHNTKVGGRFACIGATVISHADYPDQQWSVDGLTYLGPPMIEQDPNQDRDSWLRLLREATPAYAAQPYQQLAAVYRAEGHDSDVRIILVAQRRDQIARGGLRRADRWWGRLTGLLLGYGYQPWRALICLAGVLAVSVALALVLGAYGALSTQCTALRTIAKGLDLGTPFLGSATATSGNCEISITASGQVLVVSRWILQLAAWALAALFVAGFTGIVRKT